MKRSPVNLRFARSKEYRGILRTIKKTGECPFCKENFKYNKKPILRVEKDWFLVENSWPYKNTKYHFLIISEKHKENFVNLSSYDFKSVSKLVNWAIRKYKIRGGGFALRFGKTNYTGSTVNHLHFHLITPEFRKRRAKTVVFPIG